MTIEGIYMPNLRTAVKQFETFLITEELKKCDGCVTKTAESLGLHRNSLARMIADLHIDIDVIRGKKPEETINEYHEPLQGMQDVPTPASNEELLSLPFENETREAEEIQRLQSLED